jgi:uncharacterized protein involved in exopolysaccharide biosynthesis
LPDASEFESALTEQSYKARARAEGSSLREAGRVLRARRRMMAWVMGGLLGACLLYCLVAPNQYEATAKVALRTSSASSLSLEAVEPFAAASILSAPIQQETLANVLRSDALAWRVVVDLKLDQETAFNGRFARLFPGFKTTDTNAAAQAYLLERFRRRLSVATVPRTLLIQIRFRSRSGALSASVVNDLIRAYEWQESESRQQATAQSALWLQGQLQQLREREEQDRQRLSAFQRANGIMTTPEGLGNGEPGENEHSTALLQIDELGRQLVAATSDRILREAEYRAAAGGDPEVVIASDPRLQAETGSFATALLQQIHERQSALEQEQAQLSIEHGANFPRVVEIRRLLDDLEQQKRAEDAKLVERFRSAWQTAQQREVATRKSLEEANGAGMKLGAAESEYAAMRQEANSSHDLYTRMAAKAEEAGMAAGVHSSNIAVVDPAREPVKPVAPDLPLYMAITPVCQFVAGGGRRFPDGINTTFSAGWSGFAVAAGWDYGAGTGTDAEHFGTANWSGAHHPERGDALSTQRQGSAHGVGDGGDVGGGSADHSWPAIGDDHAGPYCAGRLFGDQ